MIVKIADNIFSPLGVTSRENYEAVKSGKTQIRCYEREGCGEPFMASLIVRDEIEKEFAEYKNVQETTSDYTPFEKALIISVSRALEGSGVDASGADVVFIISSTKGNVSKLAEEYEGRDVGDDIYIGRSAEKVSRHFGNPNVPLVVSNACISGVSAQILASRLLASGRYKTAIVTGCDIQSDFIVTGFQSFKALSAEACRPFDALRQGLNLGEAAATMIFAEKDVCGEDDWVMVRGAVRNDANHISGPSRTGEGSYRALRAAIGEFPIDDIAFINAHGTATLYNDEMESIAIDRAGASSVPVNALKGYYGHTMGAAGILESILSMCAIDDGNILGTRGYDTLGVSHTLDVTSENRPTSKRAFVKLLSGFGGCNGAILFKKGGER